MKLDSCGRDTHNPILWDTREHITFRRIFSSSSQRQIPFGKSLDGTYKTTPQMLALYDSVEFLKGNFLDSLQRWYAMFLYSLETKKKSFRFWHGHFLTTLPSTIDFFLKLGSSCSSHHKILYQHKYQNFKNRMTLYFCIKCTVHFMHLLLTLYWSNFLLFIYDAV